ncbi:hypothetical protein DSO57_1021670 [Entomophthora muscae]|uniref:Uncharacterized protein n=1 Tax=Entomophthora muscae TaxID=34485 RepID=A0ACC2T3B3_9FUNG|nr:hypothetical protein DSO57_1021670 [Entomophthora muscae]
MVSHRLDKPIKKLEAMIELKIKLRMVPKMKAVKIPVKVIVIHFLIPRILIKNEVVSDTGIKLPDEGPESTLKNSDNIGEKDESNGDIPSKAIAAQMQNESNMPPLPPGAPPSFALTPIPGLDYLPSLPMNPPPPTALLPRPHFPHPAHINQMRPDVHATIPGIPAPPHHFIPNYGPPQPMAGFPHFSPFQGQLPPHMPTGPIPIHNQMFHPSHFHAPPNFQIPPPPVGGPPLRPPKIQARQNYRPPHDTSTQPKGQVDILSNPAETYMRTSSNSSNPPRAPPTHPAINPLASAEGAVISAEPKLRDLKKELTSLVPTSLLRKRTKTVSNQVPTSVEPKESIVPDMTPSLSSSHSVSIKLFRPKINAAPDLGDEDSEPSSSIPAAPLLASGLLFPSKPPPPPASANPPKDEYDAFMKEMEGLL